MFVLEQNNDVYIIKCTDQNIINQYLVNNGTITYQFIVDEFVVQQSAQNILELAENQKILNFIQANVLIANSHEIVKYQTNKLYVIQQEANQLSLSTTNNIILNNNSALINTVPTQQQTTQTIPPFQEVEFSHFRSINSNYGKQSLKLPQPLTHVEQHNIDRLTKQLFLNSFTLQQNQLINISNHRKQYQIAQYESSIYSQLNPPIDNEFTVRIQCCLSDAQITKIIPLDYDIQSKEFSVSGCRVISVQMQDLLNNQSIQKSVQNINNVNLNNIIVIQIQPTFLQINKIMYLKVYAQNGLFDILQLNQYNFIDSNILTLKMHEDINSIVAQGYLVHFSNYNYSLEQVAYNNLNEMQSNIFSSKYNNLTINSLNINKKQNMKKYVNIIQINNNLLNFDMISRKIQYDLNFKQDLLEAQKQKLSELCFDAQNYQVLGQLLEDVFVFDDKHPYTVEELGELQIFCFNSTETIQMRPQFYNQLQQKLKPDYINFYLILYENNFELLLFINYIEDLKFQRLLQNKQQETSLLRTNYALFNQYNQFTESVYFYNRYVKVINQNNNKINYFINHFDQAKININDKSLNQNINLNLFIQNQLNSNCQLPSSQLVFNDKMLFLKQIEHVGQSIQQIEFNQQLQIDYVYVKQQKLSYIERTMIIVENNKKVPFQYQLEFNDNKKSNFKLTYKLNYKTNVFCNRLQIIFIFEDDDQRLMAFKPASAQVLGVYQLLVQKCNDLKQEQQLKLEKKLTKSK